MRKLRFLVATSTAVAMMLLSAVAARSQENEAAKPPRYRVLYAFTGEADGAFPNQSGSDARLIADERGNLYGTTNEGGEFNAACGQLGCGVAFKLDPAGKETVLHRFTGPPDGASPTAGLIRDEDGNLYGTTVGGGTASLPAGTVFKLDRCGKETVLYSFTGGADGNSPYAGVIRDKKGNLYGTTAGGGDLSGCGGSGCGVVFELDRTGKEKVLYSFTGGADGNGPGASVIRDEEGNLYGTTQFGGVSGNGVVFKLDAAGHESVLYSFSGGADGRSPAGLVRDGEGNLYGTTAYGGDVTGTCVFGAFGCGTVFKVDRAGQETVLYAFTGGTDGVLPYGGLLLRSDTLYGTTFGGGDLSGCGGSGCGVVFELDRAGKENVLYSFTGGADGAFPYAGLSTDEKGNFYGTTAYGGNFSGSSLCGGGVGCGVVYKLRVGEHDLDSLDVNSTAASGDGATPVTTSISASRVRRTLVDATRTGAWYRVPASAARPK